MAGLDPAYARWQAAWRRFGEWIPPPSAAEAATRMAWLDEAYEARHDPRIAPERLDAAELAARWARVERGLAALS